MITEILATVWLFTAAGLSNMAPILANKIPRLNQWNTQLDFGHTLYGKPLFGKNKTWRGLLSGIILAIFIIFIQKQILILLDTDITINNYSFRNMPTLLTGFVMGAGPLVGDAIESLFKRQIGVPPGKSWFPFDQLDYIVGAIIFTLPLFQLSTLNYASLFIIGFTIHVIASYIGYLAKLKDEPI